MSGTPAHKLFVPTERVVPARQRPPDEQYKHHLYASDHEISWLAHTWCGHVAERSETIKAKEYAGEWLCKRCCPRPDLLAQL